MFHLLVVAFVSGFLTIALGWGLLGAGALLLAPFVASPATLAWAVIHDRRVSRAASADLWIRGLRAGTPEAAANDRRTDPAALCRRRA